MTDEKAQSTSDNYEAALFAYRRFLYTMCTEEVPDISAIQCENLIIRIVTNFTHKENREEFISFMDLALIHGPHNKKEKPEWKKKS